MAFTPRLTQPSSDNRYYYADNPFYQAGVGMPNCTCYAYGRFWEISGSKPNLSLGNAEDWYAHSDGYKRGKKPKLGAVICLGNGPYSGYGHVAVVEQIRSDGTVVCSNSAWGGSIFYLKEGNSANNYGYPEYDFHGFIYNPKHDLEIPKNWIKGNRFLSKEEMQNNALIVYDRLSKRGWSINAIAGLLGNMESESTINPAIWQNLTVDPSNGYGLVQWTPSTNYTNWATSKGYKIDDGDKQLIHIDLYTDSIGQWIETSAYNISFETFKTSMQPPEWLASAFLKNYERAGVEVEDERRMQARYWYDFLYDFDSSITPPVTPDKPYNPREKKGYNFVLFNRNRTYLRGGRRC